MFTDSKHLKTIRTAALPADGSETVSNRQELLNGFDQKVFSASRVLMVGCGGLGGPTAHGLTRKGIGWLGLLDGDVVELSNLNRQWFFPPDVFQPKAHCLATNLAPASTCGTVFQSLSLNFEDVVASGMNTDIDLVICGVDNNETRIAVSTHFRHEGIPVIFLAVDLAAEQGYVFIQQPDQACFGCRFPKTLHSSKVVCRAPASIDILNTVSGLALYAVDSLLMDRPRNWNYRLIHLAGFGPDELVDIERLPTCPLDCSRPRPTHKSKARRP